MIESLTIKPIGANGIEISGIDGSQAFEPALTQRLNALWAVHPVIYFPKAGNHPEAHLRLSEVFGELAPHAMAKIRHPEHDKLIRMSYNTRSEDEPGSIHGAMYSIDGEPAIGWLPWHKDGFFGQWPNQGSMLNPVRIAYQGGQTSFLDTTQVYDELPASMRERLAELEIVFDPMTRDAPLQYGTLGRFGRQEQMDGGILQQHARENKQARIAQKLVDTHPVTGAPIINLTSMFGPVILGMDRAESDALLTALLTLAEQPRYVYTHRWQMGDLLLWDNWRCLHTVSSHPADAAREMHRSTIGVAAPMGRLIASEVAVT